MRGVSAMDPRDVSDPGLAPQAAAMASGELALRRVWGFASDARAALLVGLQAADMLVVAGAALAGYGVRYGSWGVQPPPYRAYIVIGCVIFWLVMQLAGMYRFAALRRPREHLTRLAGCWAVVVLLLIAVVYLSKQADDFSRGWILLWAVSGGAGLIGSRALMWRVLRGLQRRGRLVTHVAVVGDGLAARRCAQRLHGDSSGDVQVIGIFAAGEAADDVPALEEVARLAAAMWIDEIVVAAPCNEPAALEAALDQLSTLAVDIKVYLDFAAPRRVGEAHAILVPIWERPLAGLSALLKRGMDICLSALFLIAVLPMLGLIAALIKLDSPGPVLFRQQRFGFNKTPFTLYKFRSMHAQAGDDPSVPQATRDDPRVTRVGRVLRRTSLDELPQFYNVLKGDMSLVGPRPHPAPLDDKYAALIDGYLARHHVKPGITGWAQVNGLRGETDTLQKMERRIACDLHYINTWSPLLDLRILGRTLIVFLVQRNAY
jgi:Undecaprenyl-phosphate glucose phosphotransferase